MEPTGVQRPSFMRCSPFLEEYKYTKLISSFVCSRFCVTNSGNKMLSMNWFDCMGHQLQNKFSTAEFWKENPFSVSIKLTTFNYISVDSVLNFEIVWSFEGKYKGNVINICALLLYKNPCTFAASQCFRLLLPLPLTRKNKFYQYS